MMRHRLSDFNAFTGDSFAFNLVVISGVKVVEDGFVVLWSSSSFSFSSRKALTCAALSVALTVNRLNAFSSRSNCAASVSVLGLVKSFRLSFDAIFAS